MKRLAIYFLVLIYLSCQQKTVNYKISGSVFGTTYSVIYDAEMDYEKQFDSLFFVINSSMSTYIPNSVISKINRNESVIIDAHFKNVFAASKDIFIETNGAFDPTIGIVVNAWDFGPEGKILELDSLKLDSLMQFVGFNKVRLNSDKLMKVKGSYLDFNAIAKGYAVDVIATFLEQENIENYLVEIGGEIRSSGQNIEKGNPWNVGIDEPNFDGSQSIIKAIGLKNEAMATSGTYRKFKVDAKGNRYAHIIDTKTGYPSQTNILSVSVLASDCMTADAYATAFQAMGVDKVRTFLKSHPELKVMLIIENEKSELESLLLNGFPSE